jgi:uncharacterized membrane protein
MSTNSENTKLKKLTNAWILKEVAGGPVLVWLAGLIYSIPILFLAFNLGGPGESMSQWGQFGDYVGGLINPLFGLITIILLVFTLKQNDLALQQAADELEQTRAALLRGQAIQEATEKSLSQQISVAAESRDLNNAISLFESYSKTIEKILEDEDLNNHYRTNGILMKFNGTFEREKMWDQLKDAEKKRTSLEFILDKEHSRLCKLYDSNKNDITV